MAAKRTFTIPGPWPLVKHTKGESPRARSVAACTIGSPPQLRQLRCERRIDDDGALDSAPAITMSPWSANGTHREPQPRKKQISAATRRRRHINGVRYMMEKAARDQQESMGLRPSLDIKGLNATQADNKGAGAGGERTGTGNELAGDCNATAGAGIARVCGFTGAGIAGEGCIGETPPAPPPINSHCAQPHPPPETQPTTPPASAGKGFGGMGADAYVPPAQLQALQFLEMTITSVTDKDGQMIMISRLHALMGTAIRLRADTKPSRGHFKGGRFAPRAPGKSAGGGRGRTN